MGDGRGSHGRENAGDRPDGERLREERERTTVFRYPRRERFSWKDWTIAIVLGSGAAIYALARLALAPPPRALPEPHPVPRVAARQMQAPAAATDRSDSIPGEATAAGVRVLLRSEGTTWVDAAVDGGEMNRYEVGPGQNLALGASARLAINLGDAGVVRVKVNDRELGYIGFKGETKNGLLFTAPQGIAAAKRAPDRVPEGD